MINHHLYEEAACQRTEASVRASESPTNSVEGIVSSIHRGPIHNTFRILAGRRFNLRVKLPINDVRCFAVGQAVVAMIPAKAVRLEAGLFRRSRQRLNRWYGRVMLVTSDRNGHLITAKIHGERWSLTSASPVVGSVPRVQTWDAVSIVIDPHRIELACCHGSSSVKRETFFQTRPVYQ